jgi:hypothetical protein
MKSKLNLIVLLFRIRLKIEKSVRQNVNVAFKTKLLVLIVGCKSQGQKMERQHYKTFARQCNALS